MATQDLNGKIILAKNIHLDKEMRNVLDYTPEQMISLMSDSDHLVAYRGKYSFIRSTGTISTDFNYDDVLKSNYIAFQNIDYSMKWFFAWIDDVIWKGDANTEIVYTIDPFMTFNKDITYSDCFVVREHVNDDTIGKHIVPENLDVGELVCEDSDSYSINELFVNKEITGLTIMPVYVVETEYVPNPGSTKGTLWNEFKIYTGTCKFTGLLQGINLLFFNNGENLGKFISRCNWDGQIDKIHNIYMVPYAIAPINDNLYFSYHEAYITQTADDEKFRWYSFTTSTGSLVHNPFEINDTSIPKLRSFSGITLKNNKCYTYPYNYLIVTNSIGDSHEYRYEDFSNSNNATFDLVGCLKPGGDFVLIPYNHKNLVYDDLEKMTLGKYPTISWNADGYINWLTQQGINEFTKSATNIVTAGIGIATGGIALGLGTMAMSGEVLDIFGTYKEGKQQGVITGGKNTADLMSVCDMNNFFFYRMHCKKSQMQKIDEYFTRFGYKVNELKIPNVKGRTYFNYVEIAPSDDVGFGSIPNKYMDAINKAFRKGITIWHDHSKIGDYSVNNSIVS